jgi:hypothetical protein
MIRFTRHPQRPWREVAVRIESIPLIDRVVPSGR